MKANEKKWILIIIAITMIVFIVSVIVKNNKKENKGEEQNNSNTELVQTMEDGSKQAISEKLKEDKKIMGLDVKNITITEKNGTANIIASIENNTGTDIREFPIKILLLNEQQETIVKVGAYIGNIKKNETKQINASINMDIAEIYDIQLER